MAFLSLPLEVLQHIADCVEIANRPSLFAFSLTSRACHEASLFVTFRRITITVHDREGLRRDVDALTKALSRADSFRHIQQITIKGALRLKPKQVEGYSPQTPWTVAAGLNDILDEERVSYTGMYAVYDESVIQKGSEEDNAWAPLVNLLQAKIPLKDLVYDCQSQFPPSLLRTLHEQHPKCRLHHLTFKFRTLFWGIPFPYEMELATSPSLYRVKVVCSRRDSDGDDDFNLEAMMELTAGLAPNLQEVVILNLLPGGSLRSVRPRSSWQGLPGYTPGKLGSLKSLSLKGFSRLNGPAMLEDWERHIDFSCLHHLTLGGSFDARAHGLSGDTMEWIAQTQSFPRVKTLCVHLTRNDFFIEMPRYSEQSTSFFRNFESLEELSIDGPIDHKVFDTVLSHHGPTLRKLSLRPFDERTSDINGRESFDIPYEFTKDRILQIGAHCPELEDLAIPVKRNKSSTSEVEMYKCFGKMKKLRSLFLILDCSNWRAGRDPSYAPCYEGEDKRFLNSAKCPFLKVGDLKETFINCAIDEPLARSIWKVISEHKTGRRLERLKLWPTGEGEYGKGHGLPYKFLAMARILARSWLFERTPRDDQDGFTIRELRQEKRKADHQADLIYLGYRHDPEIWEVLQSLWPPKEGSKDWRDDWSSHPLQLDSASSGSYIST